VVSFLFEKTLKFTFFA